MQNKTTKKTKNKKKQHIEKNVILFSILHILHILLFYNHQILCKCIISYHTIAVRSSKLLFLFYPGCKWFNWGGVLFTPG